MHPDVLKVDVFDGRSFTAGEGRGRHRCEEPPVKVRRRSIGRADMARWCMCAVQNAPSCRGPVGQDDV